MTVPSLSHQDALLGHSRSLPTGLPTLTLASYNLVSTGLKITLRKCKRDAVRPLTPCPHPGHSVRGVPEVSLPPPAAQSWSSCRHPSAPGPLHSTGCALRAGHASLGSPPSGPCLLQVFV